MRASLTAALAVITVVLTPLALAVASVASAAFRARRSALTLSVSVWIVAFSAVTVALALVHAAGTAAIAEPPMPRMLMPAMPARIKPRRMFDSPFSISGIWK